MIKSARFATMQNQFLVTACALFWIAAPATKAADEETPSDVGEAFRNAMFEEEANRDLDAAMKGYESIVKVFDKQRKIAASALFRLAECHRKLDQKEQAIAAYQRLLKEFSDETTLARLSRENLLALGVKPGTESSAPIADGPEGYQLLADELAEMASVKRLMQNSPDLINSVAADGSRPPLAEAAREGYLALAMLLLDNGAAVDVIDGAKNTPLLHAAEQGHLAIVRLLLDRGADIDQQCNGHSALHEAISWGRDSVVAELIDRGADLDESVTLFWSRSGESGSFLVQPQRPTSLSATAGNRRPHPKTVHGQALHLAVANERASAVEHLLKAGCEVDVPASHGLMPLHLALINNNVEIARLLLEKGADVEATTESDYTPLALGGGGSSYQLLREFEADINRPYGSERKTLLTSYAGLNASYSRAECERLLNDGADINQRSGDPKTGMTALAAAAKFGDFSAIELLLEKGADPNITVTIPGAPSAPSVAKVTPLMLVFPVSVPERYENGESQMKAHLRKAELLLEHGAKLEARDSDGRTALFYQNLPGAGTEFLVKQGIDPRLKNKDGLMAIEATDRERIADPTLFRYTFYDHLPDRDTAIFVSLPDPAFKNQRIDGTSDPVVEAIFHADTPGVESVHLADLLSALLGKFDVPALPNLPGVTASLFRKGIPDAVQVVDFRDPTSLADAGSNFKLVPGDIVEISPSNELLDPNDYWNLLPPAYQAWFEEHTRKKIKVVLPGGDSLKFEASPPRRADRMYDPAGRKAAALSVREFLQQTGLNQPAYDIQQVSLVRSAEPTPIALNLENPESDALLLQGDILSLAAEENADTSLVRRRQGIYVSRESDHFVHSVFENHDGLNNRHSLEGLIAEIYSRENYVLPRPDFAKLKIQRLEEDGSESIISPSLPDLIADKKIWENPELIRLEWGDIVDIPTHSGKETLSWAGLDIETRGFLSRRLLIRVDYTLQGSGLAGVEFAPTFATYEKTPSGWYRTLGNSSSTHATMKNLRRVVGKPVADIFALKRKAPDVEITFGLDESPSPNLLHLREGDHFYFNPAVNPQLPNQQGVRRRIVHPRPATRSPIPAAEN